MGIIMLIDYLEKKALLPRNGCKVSFLFSNNNDLDEIKKMADAGRKIILFSVGNLAESLLALYSVGVKPDALCNSSKEIYSNSIFGYDILSTWDIISNYKKYYIIIPETAPEVRLSIIRQLIWNNVISFSFVKDFVWPDYKKINNGDKLNDSLLLTMNEMVRDVDIISLLLSDRPIDSDYLFWMQCSANWHLVYEWFFMEFAGVGISMLDIGPGFGVFSNSIKKLVNLSIDWIDFRTSDEIPRESIENIFVANIETEKILKKDKYDAIVMTEVIEHFNYNPLPTLVKIKGLLKEDGVLFISCPHWHRHYSYQTWRDMPQPGTDLPFKFHGHVYEYTHDELLEICGEAGLRIVREGVSVSGSSNLMLKIDKSNT